MGRMPVTSYYIYSSYGPQVIIISFSPAIPLSRELRMISLRVVTLGNTCKSRRSNPFCFQDYLLPRGIRYSSVLSFYFVLLIQHNRSCLLVKVFTFFVPSIHGSNVNVEHLLFYVLQPVGFTLVQLLSSLLAVAFTEQFDLMCQLHFLILFYCGYCLMLLLLPLLNLVLNGLLLAVFPQ